jgi:hypothetical protein
VSFSLWGFVNPAAAADATSSTSDSSASQTSDTTSTPTRGNSATVKKAFTSRSRSAISAARVLAPQNYPGYFRTSKYAKWYAARHIELRFGWGKKQMKCLTTLWQKESSWRIRANGAGGKYLGIPQLSRQAVIDSGVGIALFRATAELQIQLGANYIAQRDAYGTPCKALTHKQRKGWY